MEIKIRKAKIEDIRRNIEFQIREIIDYYKIDTTFEKIKETVFNENDQKDFNNLIQLFADKIANLDELNAALQVVNGVWNYFPHKSLKGLCPVEKILESQKQMALDRKNNQNLARS